MTGLELVNTPWFSAANLCVAGLILVVRRYSRVYPRPNSLIFRVII